MTVLATAAGAAMVAVALRDIFDTLFNPGAEAALSNFVSRRVWRLFRGAARRREAFALAGPFALLAVISTWAVLLALGWALIYLPQMPGGFLVPGEADRGSDFVHSLYVSLVTLSTLGFGDIAPLDGWLRLLNPMEALLGFGLLTASISWLLQIYPVLSRRRSLAYELFLLRRAEDETGIDVADLTPANGRLYGELVTRLVLVQRDLIKFPIAYYFTEADERFSLSRSLDHVVELAERGARPDAPPEVRLRATMLRDVIEDLAATVATRFLRSPGSSAAEALEAYARDHRHAPAASP